MRIASLVPSGTDLAAALGLAEHLVGVSHECDHPAAEGLPVLTRSRIPAAPAADPGEVDRAVSETLGAGDALYLTDREQLAALEPDLVITQDICDVCAVTGPAAHEALPEGATLVTLRAMSLEGLVDDLRRLGEAAGVDPEPTVTRYRRDLEAPIPADGSPRVLTLEWSDPPYLGGHWVPELVERAGGANVLTGPGVESRRAPWEAIEAERFDLVAFIPCGYDLEAATREAERLPAVLFDHPVWAFDANRLFSRLTPRAAAGALDALAAILNGEAPAPEDARRVRPASDRRARALTSDA